MRSEIFDVFVIGGGVVGAGCALDAATRGLSTALVEGRDYASGTSSRSSKLIHGGLRYLEMLDFSLVREALRERSLLVSTIAPHLVRPLPFVFPMAKRYERAYVGAGVALYDLLATVGGRRKGIPLHRHLRHKTALRRFPSLRDDAFKGAVLYYDAQVDDARFVVELVRTAAQHGAAAVNHCSVESIRRIGDIYEVSLHDSETGQTHVARARHVINATGVWSNDFDGGSKQQGVRASKGVHLVVRRDCIDGTTALITRTPKSVLFVVPWGEDHWILGTTDTDWHHDKARPSASGKDVAYILEQANRWLDRPLSRADVVGVYVGLRPLLSGSASSTAKLSREHTIERSADGIVSVKGGKYTTYRVMAKDAIDGLTNRACRTATTPLIGAGLPASERLEVRYGTQAAHVRKLVDETPELGRVVPGAGRHIAAEFVYAVTHEGALHLEDLLARRTHVSIEEPDRGVEAAAEVALLVSEHLRWSPERVEREVEVYRRRVEAELASEQAEDDASANALRLIAPDAAT